MNDLIYKYRMIMLQERVHAFDFFRRESFDNKQSIIALVEFRSGFSRRIVRNWLRSENQNQICIKKILLFYLYKFLIKL